VYCTVVGCVRNRGKKAELSHGPLKIRTVHFGDITIIYESKVSEQNIFLWLKGTIDSRQTPNFRSIVYSSKNIEPSKAYFIHSSKLAIPGTTIVQPLFLNPLSSGFFANFSQGWIALSHLWRSDQLLLHSDMFMCLNFDDYNLLGQLESQEL
jgi:hypothetical protein